MDDALAAHERVRRYLPPTPLRHYRELDAAVGHGIRVLVKHENHQPTNAFKVRNAIAALTAMPEEQRRRGIVAATRGNHGQALAWAGGILGVPVTVCVPLGNNPEKNAAMQGFGAELIEQGRDYDESIEVARQLMAQRGLTMVHSTNNTQIIAGASTLSLELFEQAAAQGESLDALVVTVGGGAHAVGALTVARSLRPGLPVYAVQAANAPAIHDSWHAGKPLTGATTNTFADGLATRSCYEFTFPALQEGLKGFLTVTEAEIAEALRIAVRTTHNLVEGAAVTGLAGLRKLGEQLAGKCVAVCFTGSNIDEITLRSVLNHQI